MNKVSVHGKFVHKNKHCDRMGHDGSLEVMWLLVYGSESEERSNEVRQSLISVVHMHTPLYAA